MPSLCRWVIASLVVCAMTLIARSDRPLNRPVSLDKIEGGDLFVLDASGTVARLSILDKSLSIKGSFKLPVDAYPTDLVSAKLFSEPTLLISSNNQKQAFVSQYSLDGKLKNSWGLWNSISGLDVDYNAHIIYVANSAEPEIYQIVLHQSYKSSPAFVASVDGAKQIGPLVCDVKNGRLLLGDISNGKILEFNLKTRKSRILSEDFGSPQALLISPSSSFLYIADAAKKKIFTLDLSQPKARPKVFAALTGFRSPSGLARLDDGRLVVSDDEAGELFILSTTGVLEFTVP